MAFTIPVDGVELADEIYDLVHLCGEGVLDVPILAPGVRPTMSEDEAARHLRERLVNAVAVRHHRALETTERLLGSLGRAAVLDAVGDRVRRRHRPDLPLLRLSDVLPLAVEKPPARFVRTDHRVREHVEVEGLLGAPEDPGEPLDLIPERLRVHHQPLARHGPYLPLERLVIEVLADDHLDGEVHRVAGAREELHRARRRLDAAVALAAVLLPLLLHHDEAPLDDGDLFRLLELAGEGGEGLAALRAAQVGVVEREELLHDRQRRLLAWTVAHLRLLLRRLGPLDRALLRRRPEEQLVLHRELRLELGEPELKVGWARALQRQVLARQRDDLVREPLVLAHQQLRRLAEDLWILLGVEIEHAPAFSHDGIAGESPMTHRHSRCGEHERRGTERDPTDELAALEQQRELAQDRKITRLNSSHVKISYA